MKLVDQVDSLKNSRVHVLHDDFNSYTTTQLWTSVLSNLGTAAVGDAANGVLVINPSDASVVDNDESYVRSTKELFLFANNKPIVFEASIQHTASATVNVAVGLMDAVAADSIVDNGGVKTTGSYVCFQKVDGGTVWLGTCGANSISAGTVTSTVAAGGSAYQKLRFEVKPYSSTQANVAFFIDDVLIGTLQLTYTGATEMCAFVGAKNGADTTVETINVDYIHCSQLR